MQRGTQRVDLITRLLVEVEVGLIHLLAGTPPRTKSIHQVVGQRNKLVVLVDMRGSAGGQQEAGSCVCMLFDSLGSDERKVGGG